MLTAVPQNLWHLMAVVDDTQGKRGSGGLTGNDAPSQAFDTDRNTGTPLKLWLAWAPIPALIVSMAAIYFAVKPTVFFEPAWLLPITNALFVTAVCFIVAYVAMKSYLATGRIQILLLGCGLLSFGLGGAIAGWVRSFSGRGQPQCHYLQHSSPAGSNLSRCRRFHSAGRRPAGSWGET